MLTLAQDLGRGQLTRRAMGLVYTTLLSIVPLLALQVVLDAQERRKLVVQNSDDPPTFLPAVDSSLISVAEGLPAPQVVDYILDRIRRAAEASVGEMTLRELAAQGSASAGHENRTLALFAALDPIES